MHVKISHRFLSWLLLALTIFLLTAGTVQAQTLKLTTVVPEGSAWMKQMRAGAKSIGEKTDGRVQIKLYGGGVQGRNAQQVQRKMRTGQVHGGAFTSGELAVFQKDAGLYSLPLVFNNVDEVRHVREQMDEELLGRLEEAGYVIFGFAGGGFAYLMSNQPLANRKDFDGSKVWTPEDSEIAYAAFKALGIAPVMMPVTDVLTGLQTDLIDSVAVPPVGAIVFQWHTRLKYLTDLPIAYVYAGLIIDAKAFGRLSEADQAVVREEFEAVYADFDAGGVDENQEAMEALLESGLERVEPDAGEVEQWREKVAVSNSQAADAGAFDPELRDRMLQILAEYRAGQAP
jgi:TRAP-type C4-dicarboxylate transport system substrate-binding protein